MPTYQFEAMDATGQEIKDVIEAPDRGRSASDDPADGLLRHEDRRQEEPQDGRGRQGGKKKRKPSPSAASKRKTLTTFTRQLSILQDAGLPILRSLRILERPVPRPGA